MAKKKVKDTLVDTSVIHSNGKVTPPSGEKPKQKKIKK